MTQLVLIVEDNEKNRKLARDVLEFKGYQVIESESAEDALQMARERGPDLILMDFHLPGMNGIEALARLRADPETRAIPVIAVTASAMTEDRKRMLEAGFNGLQTKPIHVREFMSAVEQALGNKGGHAA